MLMQYLTGVFCVQDEVSQWTDGVLLILSVPSTSHPPSIHISLCYYISLTFPVLMRHADISSVSFATKLPPYV